MKIIESAGQSRTRTPRPAAADPEKEKRSGEIASGDRPGTFLNSDLSARIRNVCWRLGLRTKDQIRTAVKKRILHPSNVHAGGFGEKSLREIRAWLGERQDITNQQIHFWRSKCAYEMRLADHTYREIARVLRLRGQDEARCLVASFPRALKNRFPKVTA